MTAENYGNGSTNKLIKEEKHYRIFHIRSKKWKLVTEENKKLELWKNHFSIFSEVDRDEKKLENTIISNKYLKITVRKITWNEIIRESTAKGTGKQL